ncbi:MAG TPA: RNA methyltransferase substrate-binding domain-containing protein, partial [Jatrophihabitantaceae bacterium]
MAGNSQRRGAVRKSKKGAQVGSGGQPKRALRGRGPTPPASERTGHPAARRASAASRRDGGGHDAPRRDGSRSGPRADLNDLLVGRNPVAEALAAKVPATALYVAVGIEADERVTEAIRLAGNRGISILELSRPELDRKTGGLVHQGLALQVPPFAYADLADLLEAVPDATTAPLLVALDG